MCLHARRVSRQHFYGGVALSAPPAQASWQVGVVAQRPISARFASGAWMAMGDVVGERAASSLLQYMIRASTLQILSGPPQPATILESIRLAGDHIPFAYNIRSQSIVRIELEWDGAVDDLPDHLRPAFARGLFQGVLAASAEGGGWGVMVVDEPRPGIVLARGIP